MLGIFLIIKLILVSGGTENFEGILVYQTEFPSHYNISTYFFGGSKLKIQSATYRQDSMYMITTLYDFDNKDCTNCSQDVYGNEKAKTTYDEFAEDEIIAYTITDTLNDHKFKVQVDFNQDKIGWENNEYYETRIETDKLHYRLKQGWFFNGWMPISHRSNRIAIEIERIFVLHTSSGKQETKIKSKLVAQRPMKLGDKYFLLD